MFGEGAELAGDRARQLGHLLDQLRALLGAVVTGEFHIAATGEVIASVDRGWATDSDRNMLYAFYADAGLGANLFAARVLARYRPGHELTFRREQLVTDRVWYRSRFFNDVSSPGRLDHSIYSIRAGDRAGSAFGLGLSRRLGEPRFDREACNTVEIFHRELVPLLQRRTPREVERLRTTLTSREQDVFELLRLGITDKEIAARLGISTYTASQHVRAIYRKFGVAGRGELLARCLHP